MKKFIRIASGQGYWGDWLEAPLLQVSAGPIDYLVMDYLAEITMSIRHRIWGRASPCAGNLCLLAGIITKKSRVPKN